MSTTAMKASPQLTEVPPEARFAGLRARLVSRLTGLSLPKLRYWHESGLFGASLRSGRRGVPRLYSWVDYQLLQIASELERNDVPTPRIRRAVEFLDENIPDWYMLADAITASERHVRANLPGSHSPLLADGTGQHVLPWANEDHDLEAPTVQALATLSARGSLGLLHSFSDSVFMSPRLNLAQPTVRTTGLETHFVAGLAKEIGPMATASLYGIDKRTVLRAVAFEEAVA